MQCVIVRRMQSMPVDGSRNGQLVQQHYAKRTVYHRLDTLGTIRLKQSHHGRGFAIHFQRARHRLQQDSVSCRAALLEEIRNSCVTGIGKREAA